MMFQILPMSLTRWMYTLHAVGFVTLFAFFFVHLYLGTVGNPGSVPAMITGWVTRGWVKKQHPKWLKEMEHSTAPSSSTARRRNPPPTDTDKTFPLGERLSFGMVFPRGGGYGPLFFAIQDAKFNIAKGHTMTLSRKTLPLSHRILGICAVVLIALYPAFAMPRMA